MIYVSSNEEINYAPKNYVEEVVTNVGMLLRKNSHLTVISVLTAI